MLTAAGVVETLLAAADHGAGTRSSSPRHDPANRRPGWTIAGRMRDGRLMAAQGGHAHDRRESGSGACWPIGARSRCLATAVGLSGRRRGGAGSPAIGHVPVGDQREDDPAGDRPPSPVDWQVQVAPGANPRGTVPGQGAPPTRKVRDGPAGGLSPPTGGPERHESAASTQDHRPGQGSSVSPTTMRERFTRPSCGHAWPVAGTRGVLLLPADRRQPCHAGPRRHRDHPGGRVPRPLKGGASTVVVDLPQGPTPCSSRSGRPPGAQPQAPPGQRRAAAQKPLPAPWKGTTQGAFTPGCTPPAFDPSPPPPSPSAALSRPLSGHDPQPRGAAERAGGPRGRTNLGAALGRGCAAQERALRRRRILFLFPSGVPRRHSLAGLVTASIAGLGGGPPPRREAGPLLRTARAPRRASSVQCRGGAETAPRRRGIGPVRGRAGRGAADSAAPSFGATSLRRRNDRGPSSGPPARHSAAC